MLTKQSPQRPIVSTSPTDLDDFALHMANIRAGSIAETSFMESCDMNDSLPRAFDTILHNDTHAVPVLNRAGRFMGMLTLRKVIKHLVDLHGNPRGHTEWRTSMVSQVPFALEKEAALYENCLHRSVSLFYAFETMGKTGRHCLSLIDERDQVYGVLDQCSIMKWVLESNMMSPTVLNKNISHFRGHSTVATILNTSKAIDGFRVMSRRNIGQVAIVDSTGRLVDQLCEIDIKAIGSTGTSWERLLLQAQTFKQHCKIGGNPKPLMVCTSLETLGTVLRKMVNSGACCVFVVDAMTTRRPVDVITFTDILQHWAEAISPVA